MPMYAHYVIESHHLEPRVFCFVIVLFFVFLLLLLLLLLSFEFFVLFCFVSWVFTRFM